MKDKFQNILKKTKSMISTKRGKISVIAGGSVIIIAVISTIIAVNINSTHAFKAAAQNLKIKNMKVNTSSTETSSATASSSSSPASSSAPVTTSSGSSNKSSTTAAPTAANVAVTSVDFTSRYVTLKSGAACQLSAKITPVNATDKNLKWTTSNSSVATVDSNGIVTGKSAGKTYIRATSTNGQRDTCTVTVTSGSGYTGGSGKSGTGSTGSVGGSGYSGSGSGSGDSHVANYQGVNKTMTFTDEITGIRQTVEFLGMGAGYCEVACGNAGLNTTAAMGAAHYGFNAVASLTGSNGTNQKDTSFAVSKSGSEPTFTISNLTAGTYIVKLTAGDGTVVAKYSFTVDSSGNVK